MKKIYVAPAISEFNLIIESNLCTPSVPTGGEGASWGGGEQPHSNPDFDNEGQTEKPTPIEIGDDIDTQAKQSSMIWDEW